METIGVDPIWMKLQEIYVMRNEEGLRTLLRAYQNLIPLIIAAHKFCEKHFPGATLILEAASDPEAVGIPDDLSVEVALEQLDQLDLDWMSSKTDTKSMLAFTVEFL